MVIRKTIESRSTPVRLVDIGPNDTRYTIFMLACMKLGHSVGDAAWRLLHINADQGAARPFSSPRSHRGQSLTASYDLESLPKCSTRTTKKHE